MLQLNHPLFRILVFCLFAALLAVAFALRAHAADIPAYDGNSETPGSNAPGAKSEMPLDRPNIEITALLPWVTDTVTEAYTLSPADYTQNLKKLSEKFTKDGWKEFTGALAKNSVIDEVSKNGMTVSILPGTPVLIKEGVKAGNKEDGKEDTYQWIVSIPVTLTYTKEKDSRNELTTISVTVSHVPLKDNLLGIQIDTWDQT